MWQRATCGAGVLALLLIALVSWWSRSSPPPVSSGDEPDSNVPGSEDTMGQPLRTGETAVLAASESLAAPAITLAPPRAVHGRVVAAESGRPVSGARVILEVAEPPFAVLGLPLPSPAWAGGRSSEVENAPSLATHAATTDENGRFRIRARPSTPYSVRVSAPGRESAELSGVVAGDDLDLRLARDEGLPCVLVLDGPAATRSVAGQRVGLLLGDGSWSLEAETDALGRFAISGIPRERLETAMEDGTVRAIVPGFANALLVASTGSNAALTSAPYAVVVTTGLTVRGRVLDSRTLRPVAGARLVADSGSAAWSDDRGEYELPGVEESIVVVADGYAPEARAAPSGTPVGSLSGVDFHLLRGVRLVGRALRRDGSALAGVRVAVWPVEPSGEEQDILVQSAGQEVAFSGEDGSFEIEGLDPRRLQLPGILELRIRPPGWTGAIRQTVGIEVDTGDHRHDVVLDVSPEIPGTVVDSDGGPLSGARVSIRRVGDPISLVTVTDSRGVFTVRDVVDGSYHVAVDVDGRLVTLVRVELPADSLELRRESGAQVLGTVVLASTGDPLGQARLRLLARDGGLDLGIRSMADASGRFAFDDVSPGPYLLHVELPSPRLPIDAGFASHEVAIDVTEEGWSGLVEHPAHPSGRVTFRIREPTERGPRPARDVEIRIRKLTRRGFRVGGRDLREVRWEVDGSSSRWLRSGEYTFGFRSRRGELSLEATAAVSLGDGDRIEREVLLRPR